MKEYSDKETILNEVVNKMNYYKLMIAYDGTDYCGWQLQQNAYSIHEALMESGRHFLRDPFRITGSSRTDAGVHALGYVAMLTTTSEVDMRKIPRAFNNHLPKDIVVHGIERVDEQFHPRYMALAKHYRYSIYNHPFPMPQYLRYAYYFSKPLDVDLMRLASQAFLGTHDFKGFCSIKTTVENTVRTIYSCDITREGEFIHIDIVGDGFLYNMVRIISGTLIEVGLGRTLVEAIPGIIQSKDREKARKTAPAHGLTLVELFYDSIRSERSKNEEKI